MTARGMEKTGYKKELIRKEKEKKNRQNNTNNLTKSHKVQEKKVFVYKRNLP